MKVSGRLVLALLIAAGAVAGSSTGRAASLAPSDAKIAASPILMVDDSREDSACGVSAPAGGSSSNFPLHIANANDLAVSIYLTGSGSWHVTRGVAWMLDGHEMLGPHSSVTYEASLPTANEQLVVRCDAGDQLAVIVNAVLRPLVELFSPLNLDDVNTVRSLLDAWDWKSAIQFSAWQGYGQVAEHVKKVATAVTSFLRSDAGRRWVLKQSRKTISKSTFLLKAVPWGIDVGKTAGTYLSWALVHGQQSIVSLTSKSVSTLSSVPQILRLDGTSYAVGQSGPATVYFTDSECDVVGGTWYGSDGSSHDFGNGKVQPVGAPYTCSGGHGSFSPFIVKCDGKGTWREALVLRDAQGHVSPRFTFAHTCG